MGLKSASPNSKKLVSLLKKIVLILLGIFGLACVGFAIFFMWVAYQFVGGGHENSAEAELKPILANMKTIHPVKLCEKGDSGWGIDNTMPWFIGYYKVDLHPDLDETVKRATERAGYRWKPDPSFITDKKEVAVTTSATSYFIATNNEKFIKVEIRGDGKMPLSCSQGVIYGKKKAEDANKALIKFDVSLPPVQR